MHEVSLVQALIEQVEKEVQQAGYTGRVVRVDLVVGRLSGAHPDALRFAFELLAPETVVAGAQLEIAEIRADCCCQACHARVPIDDLLCACPHCGSPQITIEGGRELLLQSIELDESA